MYDLIRDSTVGQILNILSQGRYLPYPEERPEYQVPERYLPRRRDTIREKDTFVPAPSPAAAHGKPDGPGDLAIPRCETARSSISGLTLVDESAQREAEKKAEGSDEEVQQDARGQGDEGRDGGYLREDRFGRSRDPVPVHEVHLHPAARVIDRASAGQRQRKEVERREDDYIYIDWDGPEDPENPQKYFVTFSISILTFAVYAGSSMYTASIQGLMEEFGSSLVVGELGLTLFIFGYGVGPMLLSPLQEIPSLGRNPVYMMSMFAYLMFTLGSAVARNMATVLVMRFFAGFFGSPALATGGATIGDIFPQNMLAYTIGLWSIGAVCGPSFAPLIGGYSAMFLGWRWPLWILFFVTAFTFTFLMFFLPETLGSTILHKRAIRLRKLTGNDRITTVGERDQAAMTMGELAYDALLRPIRIILEPQVAFLSIYLGLVYSLFYLFFESFPLVFNDIYGFNEGELGLSFMGITVAAPITYTAYALYNKYHLEPRLERPGGKEPEVKLEIGIFAGCVIPIAQFWFGWSARASVHWIVPIIGAGLYLPGVFLMFQSILIYLPMSYPMYAASVLAGNDLVRSTMASVFPLFGRAFFVRLGLGPGSSLLAGLSILMIPGIVWIRLNGKKLRAMSRIIPRDQNPAIEQEEKQEVSKV